VASHSPGPADGRKPTSSATPITRARLSIVWMTLPMTCPVGTETLSMASLWHGTTLNSGETALNRTAPMLGVVVAARVTETGGGA
jgi:hypothetical protein